MYVIDIIFILFSNTQHLLIIVLHLLDSFKMCLLHMA